MTDLAFSVVDVVPERYAVSPHLMFRVRVTESSGAAVHAIALRCQLRIEPARRQYAAGEADSLLDLFGGRDRWNSTLKPFLWAETSAMVSGFTGETTFELPVACTYDFDVVAAKYLAALRGGEVPVVLLFSGTVFTRGSSGFGVERVPWHLEASYRLPVQVWRDLMDLYFPDSGWIRLQRDSLDALGRFKASHGLTSWEQAVELLLDGAAEVPGGVIAS
ncbi:MAG: DUF6084 family protein [Actinomycetota bacterium]